MNKTYLIDYWPILRTLAKYYVLYPTTILLAILLAQILSTIDLLQARSIAEYDQVLCLAFPHGNSQVH